MCFHRSFSATQQGRGLGDAQVLREAQDQHHALPLGEPTQRSCEIDAIV
jgi:hypothetical protein